MPSSLFFLSPDIIPSIVISQFLFRQLQQIAEVLKVPAEAIKNFDEEAAIVNNQNNYEGANMGSGIIGNGLSYTQCHFNPIDKWAEALEDNKRLYETLLKSEREKIALLERMLKAQQ